MAIISAVAFLCFSGGVFFGHLKWSGSHYESAYLGLRRVTSPMWKHIRKAGSYTVPVRRLSPGTISTVPDQIQEGLTLTASSKEATVSLLDLSGEHIHTWDLTYLSGRFSDLGRIGGTHWVRDAHVFPNGDLLALIIRHDATPWGVGIVKVDRTGKLLWGFDRLAAHHSFSLDPSGNIYVLTHRATDHLTSSSPLNDKHELRTVIEDYVTLLDPNGIELKSFSLMNAIDRSGLTEPFNTLIRAGWAEGTRGDWADPIHSNTIRVISKEQALTNPSFHEGDLLICLRNTNALIVIRPETEQVVWTQAGPWLFPHDPVILPNGNLLILDNMSTSPRSRTMEYSYRENSVVWESTGDPDRPIWTSIMGRNQYLENGNVLVTESMGGRALEINRDGQVVWEYNNSERTTLQKRPRTWSLAFAYRYPRQQVPFLREP